MDVRVEVDGVVARVLIDRPTAMNALSPAVLAGLRDAFEVAARKGCSVLVLRGAGGTIMHSSFDETQEEALQAALMGARAASAEAGG